jgi:hypothetical protein
MPTGVHVKLLGWIRSAVEFVKLPAGPRKVEPQPQVPHAIDSRTVPEDVDTANIDTEDMESRPEGPINVAPESPIRAQSETSVEPESRTVVVESESAPSQQEIDRRRGMVRQFFNDYWSSADEKPASFSERLDRAEGYINERVAAGGETWRLSPATRKQLGLPPPRER